MVSMSDQDSYYRHAYPAVDRHTATDRHTPTPPAIGSTWYAWGEHWEVVKHTTRDGEPGVELKLLRAKKKTTRSFITRLFVRKAVETTKEEE